MTKAEALKTLFAQTSYVFKTGSQYIAINLLDFEISSVDDVAHATLFRTPEKAHKVLSTLPSYKNCTLGSIVLKEVKYTNITSTSNELCFLKQEANVKQINRLLKLLMKEPYKKIDVL